MCVLRHKQIFKLVSVFVFVCYGGQPTHDGAPNSIAQNALKAMAPGSRPQVFVSSSAVGYYGVSQTASFNEDSPSGKDYLSKGVRVSGRGAGYLPRGY